MQVSYRVVQEITPAGEWETIGVIVFWSEASPHLQLRSLLQHTVSRPIWAAIQQRVAERQLTLETYHEALEEYSRFYHILPEIHHLTAANANAIRRQLREKFVFLSEPVSAA